MKIERINENQIRCTLTTADLIARKLKLSELAYGTEKAKSLLQEMMEKAEDELGFYVNDTPLMIEAVPASLDSIVLIITKVDSAEAVDQHNMSKEALQRMNEQDYAVPPFEKLNGVEVDDSADASNPIAMTRVFMFSTPDAVIEAAKTLKGIYSGPNSLYKDTAHNDYILVLARIGEDKTDFNRICNMLSEFGMQSQSSGVLLAYLEEHCKAILMETALQKLAEI